VTGFINLRTGVVCYGTLPLQRRIVKRYLCPPCDNTVNYNKVINDYGFRLGNNIEVIQVKRTYNSIWRFNLPFPLKNKIKNIRN